MLALLSTWEKVAITFCFLGIMIFLGTEFLGKKKKAEDPKSSMPTWRSNFNRHMDYVEQKKKSEHS